MTRQTDTHGWLSCLLLLAFITLAWASSAEAIERQSEYKVKSAYLYNFSRLTHLPEQHFDGDDSYHLCIIGNSPFGDFLAPLEERRIEGHSLSLDYPVSKKELADCEMLFISRSEERNLDAWLKHAAEFYILTVSDIDGFARRGGMIGLITRDNRVKFEINHMAAQRCNISISAKLLELGDIVNSDQGKDSECHD